MKRLHIAILCMALVACSKEVLTHKLSTDASPMNGGTVTPPGNSYEHGQQVNLTATPSGEYLFKEWKGSVTGTTNPTSLVMDADKQVTGVFEKRQYPLTLTIEGNGTVKEEVIAMATQAQYPSGTTVRLTAQAGEGYVFKDWSGDQASKENPIQLIIQKPVSLTANFGLKPFVPQGYPMKGVNLTTKVAQNQRFFPGLYLTTSSAQQMGLQIGQKPDPNTFTYYDTAKAFLDFNQDGHLDMFAFLTHIGNNVYGDLPGKVLLVSDVWGPKPVITQHDCDTRFMPRLGTIDVDNDGQMEVLFSSEDDHMLQNGTYGPPSQTKYARITKEGVISYHYFGEKYSIHAQSYGDIDNDGDVDVFNWRNTYTNFANKLPSMLIIYLNDGKGKFTDLPKAKLNGMDELGMVQSATLSDVDGDKQMELVIVGEWMSPRIYKFKSGAFTELSTNLNKLAGWWGAVHSVDVNNDGKADLVLGNIGENFNLHPSEKAPLKLFVNDFDGNGSIDKVMTKSYEKRDVPVFMKRDLQDQIPSLKKNALHHEEYAKKSVYDLFSADAISTSVKKEVNFVSTVVAINRGNGQYELKTMLPWVQFSSIHAILSLDINKDGNQDLIMGGNDFYFQPQLGRLDAHQGLVLLGDGKGNFNLLSSKATGLNYTGMVRDLKTIQYQNQYHLLVLQNDKIPLLFKLKQ